MPPGLVTMLLPDGLQSPGFPTRSLGSVCWEDLYPVPNFRVQLKSHLL